MFGQLHRRLRLTGALQVRIHISGDRTTQTPVAEEIVLRKFDRNVQTNLRERELSLGVPSARIIRMMHKDTHYPYHFEREQALCVDNYFQ